MAISNLRKWLATGLLSLAAATTVQADTFVFTAIPDEDETKLVERYMQLTKPDVKLEPVKRAEQQEQAMRDITTMSFRHKVLERLNTRIREARIERGDLDRGQQFETAHGIINANVGDRIIFGKNDNTRGLRNNDKALITGIEGTTITAMLDRDRSTVSFDTAHYQEWKLAFQILKVESLLGLLLSLHRILMLQLTVCLPQFLRSLKLGKQALVLMWNSLSSKQLLMWRLQRMRNLKNWQSLLDWRLHSILYMKI